MCRMFFYKSITTSNFGPSGQTFQSETGTCNRFESCDAVKQVGAGKRACILFKDRKEGIEERNISSNIPTRETLAVIPAHAKCKDCAFVTLYEEYRDEVRISCTHQFPEPITEKIKDCLPCISWKNKEEVEEQRIANKSW